jgi:hypothetical protein
MTPAGLFAVEGEFAGFPLGPVSWTKLTLDPWTNPLPFMVTVCGCPVLAVVPLIVAVVGDMELTEGTIGFHCQLFCVMLWPQ